MKSSASPACKVWWSSCKCKCECRVPQVCEDGDAHLPHEECTTDCHCRCYAVGVGLMLDKPIQRTCGVAQNANFCHCDIAMTDTHTHGSCKCECFNCYCRSGCCRRRQRVPCAPCATPDAIVSMKKVWRTLKRSFVCWTFKTGHWLLLTAVMFAIYIPTYTNAKIMSPSADVTRETGVCQELDIRNSVDQFQKLKGCKVVEGYVQILLIDQTDESAYENISFPELTEITDYLLLYRVNGLKTLSMLFPNLTVIRGQKTFFNFAFVIFEMSSLQDIGLYSLTNIENGLVRIDKNPSLCYVDTIDWDLIAPEGKGEHFIKSNKLENECPICPGDDENDEGIICPLAQPKDTLSPRQGRHLCWNRQHCQKVCPDNCGTKTCNEKNECCSELCLGGCSVSNLEQCKVCKYLTKNGNCLYNCPAEQVVFLNRRCIFEDQCYNMKRPADNELDMAEKPYKVFNKSCLLQCPSNYYEKAEDSRLKCVPCKGQCRKSCNSANVDSISSAQNLRGCTHIQGSLEIQIRGGRNIVKELEENLNMIEVIDGYLKIVRSFPLISLNFLKNLKEIKGESLESGKYVFVVLDNQNLQELWDWKSRNNTLKIYNGRLFFHFNPKLCLYRIQKLRDIANLDNFTDLEVAKNSNGDKVPCKVTELKVNISKIISTGVILSWSQFKLEDHRSLLGYVVYSIEAPDQNITLYDGRDACGGDGWRVDDVNSPGDSQIYYFLPFLKSYTQYAFYVKTYTIATEQSGAQSRIYYFRTLPGEPGVPVNMNVHSLSVSTLVIQWQPPTVPNGNVTYYKVNVSCTRDDQEYLKLRNYCNEPLSGTVEDKKPVIIKQEETSSRSSNETCSCNNNDKKKPNDKMENDRVSQINFENALHNRVYIKKDNTYRRKREIDIRNTKKRYTEKNSEYSYPTHSELSLVPAPEPNDTFINDTCATKNYTVHGNTTFVLEDLPHFTKYTITIQACREKEGKSDTQNDCGAASILTTRTMSAESVDLVHHVSVTVQTSNHSLGLGIVNLKWEEPQRPNGIILTYQIEYRRLDNDYSKAMYECIPRQQFLQKNKRYILKDLPAGNYSVRVMATSLAGAGNYSAYSYFLIEEVTIANTTQIIVGLLLIAIIMAYYLRRRFAPSVPNMKLIASVNPEYVSTVYVPDDWEVSRKKIELLRELGQGSFGMVYEGIARDIVKGKPEMCCAIKTVGEHATDRERIEFLNEASVMKAFDTTHVVRLLGVVSQGQPTLVVMELMANGDLKSYLRSHRPDAEAQNHSTNRQPPTLKRILQMAIEIADGMAYLAAKKFVHRDLAARNCMVAEDLTVKIGDFGMTRDIYETDYYRKGTKGLLPVRWMAPESLKDGVFTSNSDVWSYGVVLWEMTTLASQPYQGLSNDQVLRYVIDGGIMERPENCPDKLYNLMRICWQHKPLLRPSFLDLATTLLEDANPNFKLLSFYHSTAGVEARSAHTAAQDDPSTPLRVTKEIEDFSLGSCSDQESGPENLVDDGVDNEFEGKHVTINFPGFKVASFKENQKTLESSVPSLYSYKENARSQETSGPSFGSYSEQQQPQPRMNEPRSLYPQVVKKRRSADSVRSGDGRDSLLKESECAGSVDATAAVNGYVGGRPGNNAAATTTQC